MDSRNPALKTGDTIHDFTIIRQEAIPTLQLVFYELVHKQLGTRLIHLSSSDNNNVFMVTFPTHPTNSTGVAHILEHGVLEGSKRYPVKIFKNLSGRSLNTFLNAMTSSDYTSYPFSSCNRKDFFNLMDVYMDATFFPLLNENTFLQEGWRYEFQDSENPESDLEYRGVVYNEMKGAMGNPVRLFHEYFKKTMFPDLTYANASGGDPACIPDLTYDEWKAFHARFYHPSNACFFTFGDIPLEDLVTHIHDKVLRRFSPSNPAPLIPIQTPYPEPQHRRFTYPVSQTESLTKKTFVALLWKMAPIADFRENLRLELLCTILAGDSSAILSRTLLGSNLGNGLAPIGFDASYAESVFGIGLKDTDEEHAGTIETLILNTLHSVVENGFEEDEVHAAIHELEFSALEIKGDHGVPFGLSLAFRGLQAYLAGGDFAQALKINEILEELRTEALTPGFFKGLIRKYLIDNPHRITMVLVPEQGGMEALETRRRETLQKVSNSLTETEKNRIIEQTRRLKAHQSEDGDTSCLPHIELEDIATVPDKIPQNAVKWDNINLYRHPIPTNGITYFSTCFRQPLPESVPLPVIQFTGILSDLGAAGRSYIDMARLIRQYTGGISIGSGVSRSLDGRFWLNLQLNARCLVRNHSKMMNLAGDVLCEPDLSNIERIQELLNMQKAYAVPSAMFNGHRMALLAASRTFSPLSWINHETGGMAGIRRLSHLQADDFEKISRSIDCFLKQSCGIEFEQMALTGLNDAMDDAVSKLNLLQARLHNRTVDEGLSGNEIPGKDTAPPLEAWVLSTDVSYVARAFPAVHYEHPDAPVLRVVSAMMEKPMYERIRARGGAYGAFALFEATAGIFMMITYRDPHTAQSLESFEDVIHHLASGEFKDESLHHAIVNIISNLDTPPSPREKGLMAFTNAMNGITFDQRTRFRQGILNTGRDDVVRIVKDHLVDPKCSGISILTSDKILNNDETKPLNLVRMSLED
ncbi:insulinase family protein [bacterium]|nr:insulinase family protein [candidate division CSSED10-310 bacterium]